MSKSYTRADIRNGTGFDKNARFVQVDTRKDEQYASLKETGRCAHDALAEMVAALECDYDRLEELREERKSLAADTGVARTVWDATEEGKELAELEEAAGECESREDAEQRISEDALSVEVRSDWQSVGDTLEPVEFCILLTTGGPAVRIIGELDGHKEPDRARLQTQDWGTPWTDYLEGNSDMLLTYSRQFFFGE